MVQYWRVGGINYLKYVNMCAMMMRRCYKEPHKTKALERDGVAFTVKKWQGGKANAPVMESIESIQGAVDRS